MKMLKVMLIHMRVARQKIKCTQSKAGGLGAALRPPVGPGQSPGGGPGGEAPGSSGILLIQTPIFVDKIVCFTVNFENKKHVPFRSDIESNLFHKSTDFNLSFAFVSTQQAHYVDRTLNQR